MIGSPHALLRGYKDFTPVCLDYTNMVTAAMGLDGQRSWWRKLKPTEVTVDFGKIVGTLAKAIGLDAPELKAKWSLELQNRLASEASLTQAKREELFLAAQQIQGHQIKRSYFHNVNYQQGLSALECTLLRCHKKNAPALSRSALKHGALVVIDTLLAIEENQLYAVDYPPLIAKSTDTRIPVSADDSIRTLLLGHPAFKLRWNPYCRLLARYVSLGQPQPALELLLLSTRLFDYLDRASALATVKEGEQFTTQYSQEMDRQRLAVKLEMQVAIRRGDEADVGDIATLIRRDRYQMFQYDHEHEVLDKIRAFEDDIFAGPYAFWLGLYYFLNTYGDGRNAVSSGEIISRLQSWAGYYRTKKWAASIPYLQGLDLIRFDWNALETIMPSS